MSLTRWIIIILILIALGIYLVWESKRESSAKQESQTDEYKVSLRLQPGPEGASLPLVEPEVRNEESVGRTLEGQWKKGNQAALRTEKYSTLFDNIGNIMQIVNTIAACILIVPGFLIPGPWWIKALYWLAIGILWALAYVQTALIRGLSSYFQMKASDHIIRNWQK
jgi:hypothetical protein